MMAFHMDSISYSTTGFLDRNLDAALDAIAAAGFTQAEILGQEPHLAEIPKGQALRGFCSSLHSRGFSGLTVHAPMGHNVLGAPEEDWRREKVEVLAGYLRFAGAIGASAVVIHPVPNPCFVSDPDAPDLPEQMRQATEQSLDDLILVAEEAGVRILLENLPYDCLYPFLNMTELRKLVDPYPADALGLLIDTGHAWTAKRDPAIEILAAGPRLWGTHLQDVDHDNPRDDHWVPTLGDLDWDAIRFALAQVGYAGAWTFEASRSRYGETQEEMARISRKVAESWGLCP